MVLQYEDYINGSTVATDTKTGKSAILAEDYHGITAAFRKYIVDTPEEVADVLTKKVSSNLMSIFAAVREQHPDWDEEAIYKEANIIYAEKNLSIQVVDPSKPPEKSAVMAQVGEGEEGVPTDDENDPQEQEDEEVEGEDDE